MDDLQYLSYPFSSTSPPIRFKPCYKWMTFNTQINNKLSEMELKGVLNLVINGWPSIQVFECTKEGLFK